MEGLVKEREHCPAIHREVILAELKKSYDYIKSQKNGSMNELNEFMGMSRVSILANVKGEYGLNINFTNRLFEYENILRDEENKQWTTLLAKRLQYQTNRAENEFALESESFNNQNNFINEHL